MSICCVYKITSPTGRIYIGSTNNYKKRISKYKCYDCKQQPKIYNSLIKHGFDNHKFEIVIECVESDLYKYERMYGDLYDVLSEKNLNLSLPGYNEVKQSISEKHKAKLRTGFKGRKHSEETKAKMKAAHKASKAARKVRKLSEEAMARIAAANKGRKRSEETKKKISATLKGKKQLGEHREKKRFSNTKYIFLCNQTGIFYTISELIKIFNLNRRTIENYISKNQLHKIPYQLV